MYERLTDWQSSWLTQCYQRLLHVAFHSSIFAFWIWHSLENTNTNTQNTFAQSYVHFSKTPKVMFKIFTLFTYVCASVWLSCLYLYGLHTHTHIWKHTLTIAIECIYVAATRTKRKLLSVLVLLLFLLLPSFNALWQLWVTVTLINCTKWKLLVKSKCQKFVINSKYVRKLELLHTYSNTERN